MSTLTPEDRDRLRELASGATPGPWEAYDANEDLEPVYGPMWCVANDEFHNPGPDEDAPWIAVEVHVGVKHDAEFIAASRQAVPALLDMLDQAEQRIRDLTQEARDERAACLDQIEQVQTRDARIQAVRELHHHDVFRGHLDNGCAICGHDYPCPTARAIEGDE